MGILPLQYRPGQSAATLGLTGRETYAVRGIGGGVEPGQTAEVVATADDGAEVRFEVTVRVDAPVEVEYHRHGGILTMVLRQTLAG
jgi:aconitate hydratase